VGILIKLLQVRLITRTNDFYTWKVLLEKKHLFLKNISDYLIRVYKELYKGINVAFEAIPTSIATGTGLVNYIQEIFILAEVCKPAQVSKSS
jgi:hypothetical protein